MVKTTPTTHEGRDLMEKKSKKQIRTDELTSRAIDANDFAVYEFGIVHEWIRTTTTLAAILVPVFFVLDIITTPPGLLERFAVFRAISSALALMQYFVVRGTKPTKWSFLHGYFLTLQIGGTIALMTTSLGGFQSSYYAGLNLVIIGVNLLMPWKSYHTAINTSLIIAMYVLFNLAAGSTILNAVAVNNFYFLIATAIVAVAINEVRHRLIRNEFALLVELKRARDSIWSEIELAKQIQTALLPDQRKLHGFDVAVTMIPAREVGGDYYDFIETADGHQFVTIGDVSGHGVDSGLIMMMAQTAVLTLILNNPDISPPEIVRVANRVLRENIARLDSNHYMTLSVLKIEDRRIVMSGHHQDVLLYRAESRRVETISTRGTWLGIADDLGDISDVTTIDLSDNDVILLFTDGVTETTDKAGLMYGQERLQELFCGVSHFPPAEALQRIVSDVVSHQDQQTDDITLMLLRRVPIANPGTGGAHVI